MRWTATVLIALGACQGQADHTAGERTPAAERAPEPAKEYRIELSQPRAMTVGASTDCVLTITPSAPWVLKRETPFEAKLTASEGLKLGKSKLGAKDFVDPKTSAKSVKTACVASTAGSHTLSADLTFFLCTDEICKRMTDRLQASVDAN